ncbi:MAG TPA: SUF system NifU family Fe-S cluster assembly protein [Myxococcota bacterium]|nr:SUF system NifU family Fe-S cluster assembly protein [Myxococcota bacterium]
MSDLQDLYQELILDHNARPHNFGAMAQATHQAEGYNPLCGDQVVVYLRLDGDVITDVRFDGKGCAISKASASLMTDHLKGKKIDQAQALFRRFHALVTGDGDGGNAELGKLAAFSGVREFPMRVKCATLAWHTLRQALDHKTDVVSTE